MRAANANKTARSAIGQALELIEQRPAGSGQLALLLGKAAGALGENLEALRELEQITSNGKG